jgi:hypothetical protein
MGAYGTTDLDDLSQGLTPYQVNHKAHGKATIIEANAADQDKMLLSGLPSPTLSKEVKLYKFSTVDQPSYIAEISAGLTAISVNTDTFLGPNHRLSVYTYRRPSTTKASGTAPDIIYRLMPTQQITPMPNFHGAGCWEESRLHDTPIL